MCGMYRFAPTELVIQRGIYGLLRSFLNFRVVPLHESRCYYASEEWRSESVWPSCQRKTQGTARKCGSI